ncbi:hypothetical protein B4U80_13611 [Leptotrombidium deliense]|uniref:EF-hand domain-containing protein n=1 Tax=Leptotrombidium deliense TaxID=299467 RepID=A0A443STY7_9ACAR|nr:hypothetical protein B4U80_13611 [Leptotrombidium deliense]
MKSLRKCWRNFFRFCDLDSNQYLDESEWIQCCGEYDSPINTNQQRNGSTDQQNLQQQQQQNIPSKRRPNLFNGGKRRGPNPFSSILKAD